MSVSIGLSPLPVERQLKFDSSTRKGDPSPSCKPISTPPTPVPVPTITLPGRVGETQGFVQVLAQKIAQLIRQVIAFLRRQPYTPPPCSPLAFEERQWKQTLEWGSPEKTSDAFGVHKFLNKQASDWLEKNLNNYPELVEAVGAKVIEKEPWAVFLYVLDSPAKGIVKNVAGKMAECLSSRKVEKPDFSVHEKFLNDFVRETGTEWTSFSEKLCRIFFLRKTVKPEEFRKGFKINDDFYTQLGHMTAGNDKEAGEAAFKRDPFCALLYLRSRKKFLTRS